MIELTVFDPAKYLKTDDEIVDFLKVACTSRDPKHIANAIGIAARAKLGLTQISHQTGLSREALYKSFGENGNPTLTSVVAVLSSLNLDLSVSPRQAAA